MVKINLDACRITGEEMTLFIKELVKSTSLRQVLLSDNDFGIDAVRRMIPFLRNSPNLSILFLGGNEDFNSECFEVLVSALDGKSVRDLYLYGCNITDISALDTYDLPNLQTLDLDGNNIGREGCITISNERCESCLKFPFSLFFHFCLHSTHLTKFNGTVCESLALSRC